MASPSVLVMASLSLLINALLSFGGSNGEVSKWREFDYLVLALQWPGTVCRGTRQCCSYNACCRGSNAPSEFTIHGLWPDYNDGSWPACCSHSRFDIKEIPSSLFTNKSGIMIDWLMRISSLLGALKKYWPSLSCGSPSTCDGHKGTFLAHEWEKHGTCSYPVIRNEYDYFLTTLNVYFKYNVTKVLSEAGYVASDSEKYPLGGIVSAIENAFHASPLVVCSGNDVEELRLCFYKDFKPRDCVVSSLVQAGAVSSKGSCPKYVGLPVYVSSFGLRNGGMTIPLSSVIESL